MDIKLSSNSYQFSLLVGKGVSTPRDCIAGSSSHSNTKAVITSVTSRMINSTVMILEKIMKLHYSIVLLKFSTQIFNS